MNPFEQTLIKLNADLEQYLNNGKVTIDNRAIATVLQLVGAIGTLIEELPHDSYPKVTNIEVVAVDTIEDEEGDNLEEPIKLFLLHGTTAAAAQMRTMLTNSLHYIRHKTNPVDHMLAVYDEFNNECIYGNNVTATATFDPVAATWSFKLLITKECGSKDHAEEF